MKLAVLGSGSRGNAIAVEAYGCTLLVDAGFGPRSLLQRARAARIGLRSLQGILLTHEHADHVRGAAALARRVGCPIYASAGTLRALQHRTAGLDTVPIRPEPDTVTIGPFTVSATRTSHDAAEPLALALTVAGCRVGIAYDLGTPTPDVRTMLRACGCLVIETNHDEAMLRRGPYPPSVQRRIAGSGGHLSNRAAAALVVELYHQNLEAVVLAHLSDRCNTPRLAAAAVGDALRRCRFRGRLLVASQGTPLAPLEVGAAAQLGLF